MSSRRCTTRAASRIRCFTISTRARYQPSVFVGSVDRIPTVQRRLGGARRPRSQRRAVRQRCRSDLLMARILLASAWAAVAVALLSVAVPWLTLTSALFTENLSYPLFWWMVLATCAAVWRPSPARDLIALASIALLACTRAQFAAVYVGYLLAVLAVCTWRADGAAGVRRRLADAARRAARGYPLTLIALLGIVALVFYEKASGHWQAHVEQFLGGYSNVIIRNGLPPNMGEGLLVELVALALGVGLLPAIVSLVWFAKRMSRPQMDRRWIYLAASGLVIVVFLVLTVYSQGGYLGANTEERYFFYVIPAFWLGTFAGAQGERRRARQRAHLHGGTGRAVRGDPVPFAADRGDRLSRPGRVDCAARARAAPWPTRPQGPVDPGCACVADAARGSGHGGALVSLRPREAVVDGWRGGGGAARRDGLRVRGDRRKGSGHRRSHRRQRRGPGLGRQSCSFSRSHVARQPVERRARPRAPWPPPAWPPTRRT